MKHYPDNFLITKAAFEAKPLIPTHIELPFVSELYSIVIKLYLTRLLMKQALN